MSVRILMACGPKCLRCLLEMPSGPVEEDVLDRLIASVVMVGVNCGGRLRSVVREWSLRMMCLSSRLFGSVLMFA